MRRFQQVYKCFNLVKENAVINYKLFALICLLFIVFSKFTLPTTAVFNDTERIGFAISISNFEDEKEINNDIPEEEQCNKSDSKVNESKNGEKIEVKGITDQSKEETNQTDKVHNQSTEVIDETEEISEQTPDSESKSESSKSDEEEITGEK